jgi:Na+-translocating ferredoxin:NAD+ oxidoreductase RnfG subunit
MKEFLKKTYVHYAIVLGITTLCCGLLVGLINFVTQPIIEKNEITRIEKTYKVVIPESWKNVTFEDVEYNETGVSKVVKVSVGDTVKGYIIFTTGKNSYGSIGIAACFDTNGKIVGAKSVSMLQTQNINNSIIYVESFIGEPKTEVTTSGTFSKNLIDSLFEVAKKVYEKVSK